MGKNRRKVSSWRNNMTDLLKRINELAKIAKERELTEEELNERATLREQYLKEFRQGIKETLLNTKVVDEYGVDVTPEKLKEAKQEYEEESAEDAFRENTKE